VITFTYIDLNKETTKSQYICSLHKWITLYTFSFKLRTAMKEGSYVIIHLGENLSQHLSNTTNFQGIM